MTRFERTTSLRAAILSIRIARLLEREGCTSYGHWTPTNLYGAAFGFLMQWAWS